MSLKPPTTSTDELESPLDLRTIFQHPAGLRTARHLISSIVHASRNDTEKDTFSSVSPPIFNSNPEVTRQLLELLCFSESGIMALDRHNQAFPLEDKYRAPSPGKAISPEPVRGEDGWNTDDWSESATSTQRRTDLLLQPYPRPPAMHLSYQTIFSSSDAHSSSRKAPAALTQSDPRPNASATNLNSPFRVGSPIPGTESPYRVESPSGQANGASHNSNRKNSGPLLLETNPYQLDVSPQFPPLPCSSLQPSVAAFSKFSSRTPATNATGHTHDDSAENPGESPQKETSAISLFPSVNKPFTGSHSISKGESDSGNGHRLSSDATVSEIALATISSRKQAQQNTSPSNSPFQSTDVQPAIANSLSYYNLEQENLIMAPKRKGTPSDRAPSKKRKLGPRSGKRTLADKEGERVPSAKDQITEDIWMRILEFTPPSFLKKARLVCRSLKHVVDNFDSIFINQRIEIYGEDMPGPPEGLSERQYNDLLGGKGCMEPGCTDKLSTRAHWSWYKRWCTSCWEAKVEREDKVIKAHQNQYGRTTVTQMLECIPAGMHDSFMKPHTYVEDGPEDNRTSSAPRIYRCYLQFEIEDITKQYDALTPAPYKENPAHTAAEKAAALAAHQAEMQALDQKRIDFFEAGKKKNEAHMSRIRKIEECIRRRRELNGAPNQQNRDSRRKLFTQRAQEDLPHIPEDFVKSTKCYKAATRIFRDGGTERGWQTLKPKIVKEWEESEEKKAAQETTEEEARTASAELEARRKDYAELTHAERMKLQHTMIEARQRVLNGNYNQHIMPLQPSMHDFGSNTFARNSSPNPFDSSSAFGSTSMRGLPNFQVSSRNLGFPAMASQARSGIQMNYRPAQPSYHLQPQHYPNQYRPSPGLHQQTQSSTAIPINSLLSGPASSSGPPGSIPGVSSLMPHKSFSFNDLFGHHP